MKFLYKTDTHGTAKTPSGRLDNYPLAILRKLHEVGNIIKQEKVDFVIDGGDLFHSAKISLKYAGEMARIMKSWDVPIYVIPGSHDVYDYNYDNMDNTMLGMFEKSGVVEVLKKGEPLEFSVDGLDLVIEGQEHINKLTNDKSDIFDMTTLGDLNILVVHDMLVDKPMPENVEQYILKNIATDADIILSGHYHPGHGIKEYNGKYFYNPGSFGRVEYRDTLPKVIVFDVENDNGELIWSDKFIELKSARPSKDIFDLEKKDKIKDSRVVMEQFKETLKSTKSFSSSKTIEEILEDIAEENNIEDTVLNMAHKYINKARQSEDEEDLSIKGFVEKKYKIFITDVEIENFQSHEFTRVSFDEGLNALVGESNEGKTSILRAIKWALTNEPKGTEFIRTGTDSARVKVNFSDGTFVERARTRKDAGTFKVQKLDGSLHEYAGFNNDVPLDVINTHQMPEVMLTKDIKTVLNIQDQLEGPFFLKESPANKAAIIGRLIGVQHIDGAIKEVSKDILSSSKEAKSANTNIKALEIELDKYKGLSDMALTIDYLNNLFKEKEELSEKLNEFIDLDNGLREAREDIEKFDAILKGLPNDKLLDKKIEKLESLYKKLVELNSLYEELEKQKDLKEKYSSILKAIPDIEFDKVFKTLSDKINSLDTLVSLREERLKHYKEQKKYEEIIDKLEVVDIISKAISSINEKLNKSFEMANLDEENFNAHNEVSIAQVRITKANKEYKEAKVEYETLNHNLTEYLTEVGYCPLCGGALSSEHMEHIIKGGIANE